ncbi:hypothetical protein IP92_01374 [Pseudoduganella flava]|uniref:Uncharacterized protein n=1 Tax=Pseudoduganella flava TaxID=871742 RepID=A0A562Q0D1_9BURK|nr:hypothetical protein [Pseudoduganella flava]QGZ38317.1 hypothetical protein GO485_04125 [Pseudoduganella flava]TWI50145.1 hypothetical protein IP92_01374 [Pseudoduganella flava]
MAAPLLFSTDAAHRIGSFDHGLGLIDVTLTDEAHALLREPASAAAYRHEPLRFKRLLLELTNYAHEHRHYLDTFGTLSGIGVYVARLGCIKRFIDVALELHRDDIRWRLPLSAWAREQGCPRSVRSLARFVRSHRISADFFFGDYGRPVLPGHVDDAWLDVPVAGMPAADMPAHGDSGFAVPAFPFSLAIARQGASGAQEVRPLTVVYPLGYEALVEGAAHALARELVGALFPDVPDDFLVQHRQAIAKKGEDEEEADYLRRIAATLPPYNVTDLLITKHLRRHGIARFPRRLVLRLTDIALASGGLVLKDVDHATTQAEIFSPGRTFVDELAAAPPAELARGDIAYPPMYHDAYATLLAELRRHGRHAAPPPPDTVFGAVRVWEHFLAQQITLPLLQERIDSGHASFDRQDAALEQVFDMDRPCVQVINGRIEFRHVPPPVQTAWARQMMLGELTQQLFADATTLLCPRANRLLPGMETIDLANGHCKRNERRGCGSWAPGRDADVPDCMFRECLVAYGFIPIKPAIKPAV